MARLFFCGTKGQALKSGPWITKLMGLLFQDWITESNPWVTDKTYRYRLSKEFQMEMSTMSLLCGSGRYSRLISFEKPWKHSTITHIWRTGKIDQTSTSLYKFSTGNSLITLDAQRDGFQIICWRKLIHENTLIPQSKLWSWGKGTFRSKQQLSTQRRKLGMVNTPR